MKRILEDINNRSFRNAYVLYGQEAYLQKQYRDKLVSAVLGEGDRHDGILGVRIGFVLHAMRKVTAGY